MLASVWKMGFPLRSAFDTLSRDMGEGLEKDHSGGSWSHYQARPKGTQQGGNRMLVKDWMSTDVITINARAKIQDAINALMDHHISMLPVMDNGNLVGIVTDRDIKRASPSDACLLDFQTIMYHVARLDVASIMTPDPITASPELTIEEAAEILLTNNISGVPVVDETGRLRGVITKDDIFSALISLSGLSRRGVLFGFRLEDKPGSIKEVTDIIRERGGRLVSIVTTYESAPEGYRHVYLRVFGIDRASLTDLEKRLQEMGTLLYTVDHRSNERRILSK
jgi:acetoin utilization protein AcuB